MVLVPLAAVVLLIAVTGAGAATGAARDNDNGVQGENPKIKDVDARKGKKGRARSNRMRRAGKASPRGGTSSVHRRSLLGQEASSPPAFLRMR